MVAVLIIAEQRTAHLQRMNADLVRAPRLRPEGHPGEFVMRRFHHLIISERRLAFFLIHAAHFLPTRALDLGEGGLYLALMLRRRGHRDCPVILADIAALKQ